MVRRAHQQQYRRIEPDVGVLSCASASRGADRGAAQVRWRPAMWCDDYPGAVVLTAPSNTRLKLAAPVVCGRIAFVNVPARRSQLRRHSLDGPTFSALPLAFYASVICAKRPFNNVFLALEKSTKGASNVRIAR